MPSLIEIQIGVARTGYARTAHDTTSRIAPRCREAVELLAPIEFEYLS